MKPVLFAVLTAWACAGAQQPPVTPVAFVNANVIPMDRQRALTDHTVLVEGTVITQVGPTRSARVPLGARVIDARGKYLVPGLIDVHVHLAGTREEQLAILKLFVAQGVTTVLNMRGAPEHLTLRSQIIGHAPRTLGIDAMFEERQYAVAHAEEFIYDRQHSSRDFEKVEPQVPSLARRMVDAGIWLMPNLTAFRNIAEQLRNLDSMLARSEMQALPRTVREGWGPATNPYTRRMGPEQHPHIMARHALLQTLTREFHDAGVRLLLGTDAMSTGTVPGYSAHDELGELVAAGLTPYEALRTATANAATFLGSNYRSGTIAAGKNADLVLLDTNPLESIANTRRIAGVMVRRRWQ